MVLSGYMDGLPILFGGKARHFGCNDRDVIDLRLLAPLSVPVTPGINVLCPQILLQPEDGARELRASHFFPLPCRPDSLGVGSGPELGWMWEPAPMGPAPYPAGVSVADEAETVASQGRWGISENGSGIGKGKSAGSRFHIGFPLLCCNNLPGATPSPPPSHARLMCQTRSSCSPASGRLCSEQPL